MTKSKLIIETKGLTKEYPGVIALDQVDFDLCSGEVHVLFGENGAGKSTLISMLAGSNTPSAGTLLLDNQPMTLASVKEARAHGIYTVFQEFSLIPTMSVTENLFLANEPKRGPFIDSKRMKAKAREILEEFGFDMSHDRQISSLSRARQQMIEIAKAMMGRAQVLILDEPTASLTDREVAQLFESIKRLKAKGVGIIYITHRIQEIRQIGDRVSVLRDGKMIATVKANETSEHELISLMTGREISEIYPKITRRTGKPILKVANLKTLGIHDANFVVKEGEILGVAGLVGSGKSRLWRTVVGLGRAESGTITYQGQNITNKHTRDILNRGMHYLSPDRKAEGLDLGKRSDENLAIDLIMDESSHAISFINWQRVKRRVKQIGKRIALHKSYLAKRVSQLSGGNQQRVLFGKCFARNNEVYIFDEPTVGVDVGTRTALYDQIKSLAEVGKAIVLISSDLPEIMNLSHRLMVLSHGQISAILEGKDINEKQILKHFFNKEPVEIRNEK